MSIAHVRLARIPDRSTVVHTDCMGIMFKQKLCVDGAVMIFLRALSRGNQRNYIFNDSQAMYKMFNNRCHSSKVNATKSLRDRSGSCLEGRATQVSLNPNGFGKHCTVVRLVNLQM